MKKRSVLMLLFAAMTIGLVSCGKDDGGIGNRNGLPTFATLYSYIGRTDINAIKEEFSSYGYKVWVEENDQCSYIEAEKDEIDCYKLIIDGGNVIRVEYGFVDESGWTESQILSNLNDENKFRNQSEMTQYSGVYNIENGDESSFTSKNQFIDAIQNILQNNDLSSIIEIWSKSTYSNVITVYSFTRSKGIEYGVAQI